MATLHTKLRVIKVKEDIWEVAGMIEKANPYIGVNEQTVLTSASFPIAEEMVAEKPIILRVDSILEIHP